ncbi:MAG: DNA mismatch repair endonuclease MutL [Phycisphaerales bacterium]|nr:DNA mismatch repair endonuclease MutL [Planctomycetota bacterium]MCH8509081.1 DNA mismatch repair endonuclease MutL [Phycisphaerales bacterium]
MPTEGTIPNADSAPQPAAEARAAIRRLPPLLVNQIAAGEVIERPASVVKEVVENAIDAGANRIVVDLEGGGVELIRVSDDGYGIPPDQMPLAVAPHATSKIAAAEDLDRIGTMGFRGEALASIASVSRLRIVSRAAGEPEGREIAVEGEHEADPRPAARAVGTTVEVRNLFFNTPARRKFLRTPGTEQTRCLDWLKDLAMAHPALAVRCVCDGTPRLDLPPGQSPRERAVALLGKELEDQLLEVSVDRMGDARGVVVWGLVGLPSIARATAKAQHLFLNGRTIRDRTVQHALREAYRGLIEPGRHPTAVLMIEMSPSAVDVNVHPAKLEVRFRDQSMVHRAIYHGVRDALGKADVTPTALQRLPGLGSGGGPMAILPPATRPPMPVEQQVDRLVEFLKSRPAPETPQDDEPERLRAEIRKVLDEPLPGTFAGSERHEQESRHGTPEGEMPRVRPADRVLQIHSSYLVTQDAHGVVIIDQHALHERVMFEKLLARVTGSGGGAGLERQQLLTPIVIESNRDTVGALEELTPLFDRLGFEIAALGPKSVGVRAVPTFLVSRGVEPGAFVEELLDKAVEEGFTPGSEEALHEVLDMMACKAAIKAGDRLSDDEMDELLRLRETVERSGSCPHGRATTVRLTIAELERLFDRR